MMIVWRDGGRASGGAGEENDSTGWSETVNTLSYRGYTARVEFDERDNIFVGRVLGVRDIISFHGETVAQLRAELESAVNEYLEDCKEQGLEPEKPASGKMLLRVPPEVHAGWPAWSRLQQRASTTPS